MSRPTLPPLRRPLRRLAEAVLEAAPVVVLLLKAEAPRPKVVVPHPKAEAVVAAAADEAPRRRPQRRSWPTASTWSQADIAAWLLR